MIRFENILKAYGPRKLLNHISYHFPEGECIALVGANGQGKSTLLNILTGADHADDGRITKPKAMRLGFLRQSAAEHPQPTIFEECLSGHEEIWTLRQEMDAVLKKMETEFKQEDYDVYEKMLSRYETLDGYALEGTAARILKGLGIGEELFDQPPQTLSGGWRMRLELAKTLTAEPDFLILDEPTNHLDLPAIEWLEEFLADFKGTVLFVTHDRALLDSLPTIVLAIGQGVLAEYKGNYSDYLEQKEQRQALQSATVMKLQRQRSHMQKFVDRFGAKASKATQAAGRKKMIERLDKEIGAMPEEVRLKQLRVTKLVYPKSAKNVLSLENLSVGYDKPLLRSLHLDLQRGEKRAVTGRNGLGKSTLLKTLAGDIDPLDGNLTWGDNVITGFFRQDAAERIRTQKTIFQTFVETVADMTDQEARAMLGAFMFAAQDIEKPTAVLSGGERSRLALCMLLALRPNCLLLDEPTNHLDLDSKNILARALKDYPGSILFVSHDRDFMETIADDLWDLSASQQSAVTRK